MLKIAIAQLNPIIGDLTGNSQELLNTAKIADSQGVQLLLTPELSLCGYPPRDLLMGEDFVKLMQQKLIELAQALPSNISVLVGVVTPNPNVVIDGGKPLYNSIALLQKGKVQQRFHKQLLPTYDVFDENRYFQPGTGSNYFELEGVKIGVTICEDLWNEADFWGKRSYLVNPVEDLVKEGVDLVVNLSASPFTVGKPQLREEMLKYTAIKYGLPLLYNNQVGANDDLIFDGGTLGFNGDGNLICRGKGWETDLLIIEFAAGKLGDSTVNLLVENYQEQIWRSLVLGVRDYCKKCGFKRVLLGLSGGIDSALVAAIAVEALGKEQVLGVLMPSPYSSDHSVNDALKLAGNLGVETTIIPIADLMKGFDQSLEKLFANHEFGLAEENIQSRIRGNLLMAIANKFGHLLLSTGNKSEMAVGYCTLYGDMNGGLAVIADVPKTEVYRLCNWLNKDREIIPQNIINKPPSAELKPGQLDQDSLPEYDILDGILTEIICYHRSAAEIINLGYDSATVHQVVKLVQRAEFKRRQAPPGLKITDRAFGTGWRMPIARR